jgi:hypothetical protein
VHGHDRVQIVLGPGGTVASSQLLGFDAHRFPFCSGCVREPDRLVLIRFVTGPRCAEALSNRIASC